MQKGGSYIEILFIILWARLSVFGVGCEFSTYSDVEMYTATTIPITAAKIVFLLKIIQVHTHKPKYVKYRVKYTHFLLFSCDWSTHILSFITKPFAHFLHISGPSPVQEWHELSQLRQRNEPSLLTQNWLILHGDLGAAHSLMSMQPLSLSVNQPALHFSQPSGPGLVQWPLQAGWHLVQRSLFSSL